MPLVPVGPYLPRFKSTFRTAPRQHHLTWTPSTDFGIVVHTGSGRLVKDSAFARRLLVP